MATATLDVGSGRRVPWPALAGLAIAVVAGVALASTFWMTDLLTAETIANWQQNITAGQSGPAVALAMMIALGIGASMVVLPCGFPAVFAVPTSWRARSTRRAACAR